MKRIKILKSPTIKKSQYLTTMENSIEVSQKTKNRTTISSRNPAPGHISEETINQKDTCTCMFIAALFTIAKTWKQPNCPSINEWIKKIWYICKCVCIYTHTYTHIHTYNGILPSNKMKKKCHLQQHGCN